MFDNVISGVSLTAKQVTSQTTTVKVASDNESLVTATTTFVDQYNKLMDKIKALTFFDEQAQSTGLLFGSKETLQIQRSFERLVTGRFSVTGKLKSLQSIGVTVDDTGKLSFSNSKLRDQIASDPNGVKELLSNSTSGLQKKVDELAERIAGENNSTLILKSQSITAQIEFSNKRIDEMTARLDLEKERMLNQFYAMEAIIGKLQGNQQYVSKIASLSSS